jgi:hypothetical protein
MLLERVVCGNKIRPTGAKLKMIRLLEPLTGENNKGDMLLERVVRDTFT